VVWIVAACHVIHCPLGLSCGTDVVRPQRSRRATARVNYCFAAEDDDDDDVGMLDEDDDGSDFQVDDDDSDFAA
jgi:hypothetical protein